MKLILRLTIILRSKLKKTELPTVTKKSYLLRKSEGNTKIRKRIQKIRIHETKKKKKKTTTKDRDIAKSLYTVQCMQHTRAHDRGMDPHLRNVH